MADPAKPQRTPEAAQPDRTKADTGKPGQAKPAVANPAAKSRPDFATIGGIALALSGIVGGLLMEGGKIKDISQITAAFIEELTGYATKARKNGLVFLGTQALEIQDAFLRKALTLVVDGTDLEEIRNMMQLEIRRGIGERPASAGGYQDQIPCRALYRAEGADAGGRGRNRGRVESKADPEQAGCLSAQCRSFLQSRSGQGEREKAGERGAAGAGELDNSHGTQEASRTCKP